MCRLSIDRSSLVAAAVVDRCGLVRGGVVHRRESVVDLVVNGLLQVRAWLTWKQAMVKPNQPRLNRLKKASSQSKSAVLSGKRYQLPLLIGR